MNDQGRRRAASITAITLFVCACVAGFVLILTKVSPVRTGAAVRSNLPPAAPSRTAISSAAKKLSAQNTSSNSGPVRDLIVVNRDSPIPTWFTLNLADAFGVKMDADAASAFAEMRTQASKDGLTLWISSAYRSSSLQNRLFQQEVETCTKTCPTYEEAESAAERAVAKPGCSEHGTGLALDLNGVKDNFDQTPAFRWLNLHAQDYGFILRYPKGKEQITKVEYEPWHYRYVGIRHAQAMKKDGLCLEEYAAQETGVFH